MTNRLFVCVTLACTAAATGQVQNGIDVLRRADCDVLQGRNVGLITNHTGRTLDGTSTVAVLRGQDGVTLRALFAPEHGIEGQHDERFADATQAGLPVHSLYGETRKPTAEQLAGIDTLVFDVQDVGCRFYTYVSTMGLALEAAAERGLRFVVLDRPNPLGGVVVEGPMLDADATSFTAWHPIPVRHGMTAGELARMFVAEKGLELDLHVVPLDGWRRSMTFDDVGQTWVDPSPNLRSLRQAFLYPGIGLLEMTNLSVGRGTDTPFELFGAPWVDARAVAAALNGADLPGVVFVPREITPRASKFAGERCGAVELVVTDRATFRSVATGLAIACTLRDLHEADWQRAGYAKLLGHREIQDGIEKRAPAAELAAIADAEARAFLERRAGFLLYP